MERAAIHQFLPPNSVLQLYKALVSSGVNMFLSIRQGPLQLSHHLLPAQCPLQEFIVQSIDTAIAPLLTAEDWGTRAILPTLEEIQELIVEIPLMATTATVKCAIDLIIRRVAIDSGVGKPESRSAVCPAETLEMGSLPSNILFEGIFQLMKISTRQRFLVFHRMFAQLPVMRLYAEALETVGYHYEADMQSLLAVEGFADPQMRNVYRAFVNACVSLEKTAAFYHSFFGKRSEEDSTLGIME